MKIAIMQPYWFPYIGYFQLINMVDEFIIYDNIEYTRKGWINRNRILVNGQDVFITIPLKKDSDFLNVNERYLTDTWSEEKLKLINKIKEAYRKAPYFKEAFPFIEQIILCDENNLFRFILNSVNAICSYLEIKTQIIISSSLEINPALRGKDKVIDICKTVHADEYINPIGGVELYTRDEFAENGISLLFFKTNILAYQQFDQKHVPFLSIIDVMMFNSKDIVQQYLAQYKFHSS